MHRKLFFPRTSWIPIACYRAAVFPASSPLVPHSLEDTDLFVFWWIHSSWGKLCALITLGVLSAFCTPDSDLHLFKCSCSNIRLCSGITPVGNPISLQKQSFSAMLLTWRDAFVNTIFVSLSHGPSSLTGRETVSLADFCIPNPPMLGIQQMLEEQNDKQSKFCFKLKVELTTRTFQKVKFPSGVGEHSCHLPGFLPFVLFLTTCWIANFIVSTPTCLLPPSRRNTVFQIQSLLADGVLQEW